MAQRPRNDLVARDAQRAKELAATGKQRRIATKDQRQEFWTEVMLDPAIEKNTQLRASELLAKSEGDFVERREITGPNGGPMVGVQVTVAEHDVSDRAKSLLARRVTPVLLGSAEADFLK